jgi:DNA processing protein
MEYDELVYACALNRIFNYACDKARALVEMYPCPEDIFRMGRGDLEEIFGKGSPYVDHILNPSFLDRSSKDVDWANSKGIRIFYIGDADYPWRLKECVDAPVILYYKGTSDLNSERVVSIVGSRRPSDYGVRVCQDIVESFSELEKPPVIVSGLAYGIDIAAHERALRCGLETVGVMATGLDKIYPAMHKKIAMDMVGSGGLVSDFPAGTVPVPVNFVRRNRIIAGLCDATVLVESKIDGGGVITSRMAHSYNRDVFAVPGRWCDELSQGCNALIRESCAEIVSGRNSVRGSLGWKNLAKGGDIKANFRIFENCNEPQRRILELLCKVNKATVDELISGTGLEHGMVMVTLTELEIEGKIRSDLIGRFMIEK